MKDISLNHQTVSSVLGACDWGFVNPGVLQAWAILSDDRMCLVAEHYHTRKTIDWWIERAKEMTQVFGVDYWVCDPSEPSYIEQFRRAGLIVKSAFNDIMPGITAVQDRLIDLGDRRPRLTIYEGALLQRDESLVETRQPWSTHQEIPAYVWAKNVGGETLKDKPVDAFNHGLDCLRYAVAERDLRRRRVEAPAPVAGETHFQRGQGFAGTDPWAFVGSGDG